MKNELIHVSSKLMQNYHLGHPVSAGTQIATFMNCNGQVEVISIGNDFKLYNFYPDTTGTSWTMKQILLPDNANAKEIVAVNVNGAITLLVKIDKIIKGKGLLSVPLITMNRFGAPEEPFLPNYLMEGGGSTQLPVDPDSIFLLSRQLPDGWQLAYSGQSTKDKWLLTHQVYPSQMSSKNSVNYIARSSSKIYSSALLDYINPSNKKKWSGTLVANKKASVHPEDYNRVEFEEYDVYSSRNFAQGIENTCGQVATTHLPNAAFAIRTTDKALLYLTSNESEANGKYDLTVLSNIEGENGGVIHQPMSHVYATTDAHQRPMAFTLNEEGYLFHTEQKEDGTWSALGIIESHLNFKHLSVSKNNLGNPIVFGVTTTGDLWRVWLDNDPQVDLWQKEEIEIVFSNKSERKAEEINTYSTEVTVYDKSGIIRPNAKVKVWSGGSQNLIINGKGYIINKTRPAEVLSNDAGKLSIVTETNDIAASIIHIWTEYMDDDKGVAIQANGYIQDKFSKITTEELLAAQGKNGELLKGEYRETSAVQSMVEALNSSMAIINQSAKADAKLNHKNYSHVISGSKCHHVTSESFGQRHRINQEQNYSGNWKLSFESGTPVYTSLSNDETSHHMSKRDIDILDMQAFGFFDFLSDVWRMVKEGVAKLVDIVISGIQAAVTVLIDGVKKIWRGLVNFVDEIFQAVLGFFESVKVFFVDLFHWLGTIFNWKNILLTKKVINHSFNVALDFASGPAIDFAKGKVDERISNLESKIHKTIQDYIKSIGGKNPLIEFEEQQNHKNSKSSSVEHNVMTNAVMNNYKKADTEITLGQESITNAFNTLKPIAENFSTSEEWEKAKAYFNAIKSNPDKVIEFTMAGLLELTEAITIWALEKIKDAMDAILDAVSKLITVIQNALNTSVYIPLVTEIYNLVKHQDDDHKGLPFTYLDLVSILVAMPTTVITTLVTGKAPFSTDASVEAFEAYFTVDWLSQKTGITPATNQRIAPETINHTDVRNFFNSLSGMTYAITAVVKPAVDTTTVFHETTAPGTPAPPFLRILSFMEAYLNTVGWIGSTPWAAEKEDEYNTQGFEVLTTIWFIELFDDVLVDWIFFFTEPEGLIESCTTTIFSTINLAEYIALATIDSERGFNVCKTLPGVFSIGRPLAAKLPKPYGPPIGAGVIALIDVVSNGVMAGFAFAEVETEN